MSQILLWVHVLAAAVWIGAAVATLFLAPRMSKNDVSGQAFADGWVEMGRKLFTPAAIVALATGIGLVIDSSHEFSDGFVSVGFLMVIVGAGLGMAIYAPRARAISAAHAKGEETAGLYAKLRTINLAELALLAFTVYAMVVKLGA